MKVKGHGRTHPDQDSIGGRDLDGQRAGATTSLAHAIANDGIARHEDAVAAFARWAGTVGPVGAATSLTVLAVLLDRTQPAVVRERAFGRVAVDLAQRTPARQLRRSA